MREGREGGREGGRGKGKATDLILGCPFGGCMQHYLS